MHSWKEEPLSTASYWGRLDPDEANVGYAALIGAAFIMAVERRFIKGGKFADESEVIEFVAQVREVDDEMPDIINPDLAESLILCLLEKGEIIKSDADTRLGHQFVLLSALVGREEFSEAELGTFLDGARRLADELLGVGGLSTTRPTDLRRYSL